MVRRTRLSRSGGKLRETNLQRVTVTRAGDMGDKFWAMDSGKSKSFGYTARGVRDKIENTDGVTNYYLWDNNIATFDANKNTLTVRDTGWKTPTTKERLNNVITSKFGYDTRISQEKHVWFIEHKNKKYKWSDGDNVIDLSNPTKNLSPVDEPAMKAQIKEKGKSISGFVKGFKDKIFGGTMSESDFDELQSVFDERGRNPVFSAAFLRNERGEWDYDKLKDHWNLIAMDLRGVANKRVQRGQPVESPKAPEGMKVGYATSIQPKAPFFLLVPSIGEIPATVRQQNVGKAFALGDFYDTDAEALRAVLSAGYGKAKQETLRKQGYFRLKGES